jgi:hypothetical protein
MGGWNVNCEDATQERIVWTNRILHIDGVIVGINTVVNWISVSVVTMLRWLILR